MVMRSLSIAYVKTQCMISVEGCSIVDHEVFCHA